MVWDVLFDSASFTELSHLRVSPTLLNNNRRKVLKPDRHRRHDRRTERKQVGLPPPENHRPRLMHRAVYLAPAMPHPSKVLEEVDWTSEGDTPPWRAIAAWASDLYFGESATSSGLSVRSGPPAHPSCVFLDRVHFVRSAAVLLVRMEARYVHIITQEEFGETDLMKALAGSEAALIGNLSAFALAYKSQRVYTTSRNGLWTHRFLTIVLGMGCYIIPLPSARLICITVATWTGWLALYGDWIRLKGSPELITDAQSESSLPTAHHGNDCHCHLIFCVWEPS